MGDLGCESFYYADLRCDGLTMGDLGCEDFNFFNLGLDSFTIGDRGWFKYAKRKDLDG